MADNSCPLGSLRTIAGTIGRVPNLSPSASDAIVAASVRPCRTADNTSSVVVDGITDTIAARSAQHEDIVEGEVHEGGAHREAESVGLEEAAEHDLEVIVGDNEAADPFEHPSMGRGLEGQVGAQLARGCELLVDVASRVDILVRSVISHETYVDRIDLGDRSDAHAD